MKSRKATTIPTELTLVANDDTAPPRQFLLMVEQKTIALMAQMMPSLQYVEVHGVEGEHFPHHVVLCNPKVPPAGPTP